MIIGRIAGWGKDPAGDTPPDKQERSKKNLNFQQSFHGISLIFNLFGFHSQIIA